LAFRADRVKFFGVEKQRAKPKAEQEVLAETA